MSSTIGPTNAIKIFFCYAHEDEALRNELEKQLRILQRQGLIVSWHDREIDAGEEWLSEIDMHLKTAQIILLLVSPDFMDSDYCYGIEMKRALERHEARDARVIPIILRPVHWEDAPFSKLQVLPTDGEPVMNWLNRDKAFLNITIGIRKVVKELLASYKTKEGDALYYEKRYAEALSMYEQAIQFDPNFVSAYIGKGNALSGLNRYTEALSMYEQAIQLDPNLASAYTGKDKILGQLEMSIKVQQQLETQLLKTRQQLEAQQLEAQQLESQLLDTRQEIYTRQEITALNRFLESQLLDTREQLETQRKRIYDTESQLADAKQQLKAQQPTKIQPEVPVTAPVTESPRSS